MEVSYFFWEGGVYLPPTDPLDPLEVSLEGHLLENFPRKGVSPNFKSRGGGGLTPQDPLTDIYGVIPLIQPTHLSLNQYLIDFGVFECIFLDTQIEQNKCICSFLRG